MNILKTTLLFSFLNTLLYSESITLEPLDVLESNLSKGTLLISPEEAKESATVTLQE